MPQPATLLEMVCPTMDVHAQETFSSFLYCYHWYGYLQNYYVYSNDFACANQARQGVVYFAITVTDEPHARARHFRSFTLHQQHRVREKVADLICVYIIVYY